MIEKLLKAAYHYYVLHEPIMSDAEYDKLFEIVQRLEKDLPQERRITDKVCLGYFEGGANRPKYPHPIPMLSLQKDNDKRVPNVIQTPKYDGAALEVIYRKGVLQAKVTRGDGYIGGDVTKHHILNIPNFCDEFSKTEEVIVRGEVMCDKWEGKRHVNFVSGKLNQLDPNEVKKYNLYFIAYFIHGFELVDYLEQLNLLKKAGFTIPPYRVYEDTNYDFTPLTSLPTDGFVFRERYSGLNQDKTSHHYKHSWAWKPEAEVKETIIREVNWSQSKNGVWTPVAIIDPVEIDGSTINKVNLASISYIEEKDLAIEDVVLVRKAKEIIPEIAEVVERPPHRIPIELHECPKCGEPLIMEGVYLKCPLENCAVVKKIEFFCKEIGIKGLSGKSIALLNIDDAVSLYTLTEDFLQQKLGQRGLSVYREIQKSKIVPLAKLLSALNPPLVKEATFKKIFDHIDSYEDLFSYEKLLNIKGIGERKALELSDWMQKNETRLRLFKEIGFDFATHKEISGYSYYISITGSFPDCTRKVFEQNMLLKRIYVSDSVTKKSQLLVIGNKPSPKKIEKAQQLGIPIVAYESFIMDIKGYTKD